MANIADVRVGEHEDDDRVVIEFQAYEASPAGDERAEGIPEHLCAAAPA